MNATSIPTVPATVSVIRRTCSQRDVIAALCMLTGFAALALFVAIPQTFFATVFCAIVIGPLVLAARCLPREGTCPIAGATSTASDGRTPTLSLAMPLDASQTAPRGDDDRTSCYSIISPDGRYYDTYTAGGELIGFGRIPQRSTAVMVCEPALSAPRAESAPLSIVIVDDWSEDYTSSVDVPEECVCVCVRSDDAPVAYPSDTCPLVTNAMWDAHMDRIEAERMELARMDDDGFAQHATTPVALPTIDADDDVRSVDPTPVLDPTGHWGRLCAAYDSFGKEDATRQDAESAPEVCETFACSPVERQDVTADAPELYSAARREADGLPTTPDGTPLFVREEIRKAGSSSPRPKYRRATRQDAESGAPLYTRSASNRAYRLYTGD